MIGGSGTAKNTFDGGLQSYINLLGPTATVSFSGDVYSTPHAGAPNVNIDASGNSFGGVDPTSGGTTLAKSTPSKTRSPTASTTAVRAWSRSILALFTSPKSAKRPMPMRYNVA